MKRRYELKQRAERQDRTRQRIVEATIELHASKGPARTTLSDIARRAGVQRHTLYRHFPDALSLGLACSGLYAERNPLPDPRPWLALAGEERLRRGIGELYHYYERNEPMLSRVTADTETHALTRQMSELRFGEAMAAIHAALATVLPRRKAARATLDLALEFRTWQRLRRSGLSTRAAIDTVVRALLVQ